MAHLPQNVLDQVMPVLLNCASKKWHNAGYSLNTFNLLKFADYSVTGSEEDITIIELLNKYHFWFVSFDEFDAQFYCLLKSTIADFNKTNKQIKLKLSHETGGHQRIICQSDSDNYGTFYFLITAQTVDGTNFQYVLPSKLSEVLTDEDKKEYDKPDNHKYIVSFPELSDMDIYQDAKSSEYYTYDECKNKQVISFSDDNYNSWKDKYCYCYNVAVLEIYKQHVAKYSADKKRDTQYDEKRIKELSEKIANAKTQYVAWDVNGVQTSQNKKMANILGLDVNSSQFQIFLKQLQILSDSDALPIL